MCLMFIFQTGTLCELEEKFEPKSCEICYANPHFDITNLTSPCGLCFNQMHIYGHYLDLIFTENAPHTCTTTRRSATSGARSLLLRPQQWPVPPETFYMFLSITLTITLTMFLLNCGPITLTSRDRRGRQPIDWSTGSGQKNLKTYWIAFSFVLCKTIGTLNDMANSVCKWLNTHLKGNQTHLYSHWKCW